MPLTADWPATLSTPESVVRRLPGVDDDGQIQLTGERHLDAEHRLLRVLRRDSRSDSPDLSRRWRSRPPSVIPALTTVAASAARPWNRDAWCGWTPTATRISGQRRRTSTAAADSVVSPAARMHIARCTPAARARPTTSARSGGKYLVREMTMAIDHRDS